ncbi:MAG TPA: hypothetical protein VFR85_17015 [Anaeromyxobacteraceae bacterium]|nr:hypothetical protein [Anaeromyxobacteraceae bacterium]
MIRLASDAPLAFRPATVVARLPPRSAACPLSLRDLAAVRVAAGGPFPLVMAPAPEVARAALVAAAELSAAIGLELPEGERPDHWFAAVVRAADEFAPRLPVVLSATVALGAGSDGEVERARREAFRLVEAGLTHLVLDLSAVPEGGRVAAVARAAQAAREREIGVEGILPLESGRATPGPAAALLEELAESGLSLDAVGAHFPLPRSAVEERGQARQLAELCGWAEGTPVIRRGPVTSGLLEVLAASPLLACEDGGAAAAAAARAAGRPGEGEAPPLARPGERPAPPEMGDRPEALAYEEVAALVERLGRRGSSAAVAASLRARLEE